jgi:hypothetical protein
MSSGDLFFLQCRWFASEVQHPNWDLSPFCEGSLDQVSNWDHDHFCPTELCGLHWKLIHKWLGRLLVAIEFWLQGLDSIPKNLQMRLGLIIQEPLVYQSWDCRNHWLIRSNCCNCCRLCSHNCWRGDPTLLTNSISLGNIHLCSSSRVSLQWKRITMSVWLHLMQK